MHTESLHSSTYTSSTRDPGRMRRQSASGPGAAPAEPASTRLAPGGRDSEANVSMSATGNASNGGRRVICIRTSVVRVKVTLHYRCRLVVFSLILCKVMTCVTEGRSRHHYQLLDIEQSRPLSVCVMFEIRARKMSFSCTRHQRRLTALVMASKHPVDPNRPSTSSAIRSRRRCLVSDNVDIFDSSPGGQRFQSVDLRMIRQKLTRGRYILARATISQSL